MPRLFLLSGRYGIRVFLTYLVYWYSRLIVCSIQVSCTQDTVGELYSMAQVLRLGSPFWVGAMTLFEVAHFGFYSIWDHSVTECVLQVSW